MAIYSIAGSNNKEAKAELGISNDREVMMMMMIIVIIVAGVRTLPKVFQNHW
ncbi:hypothetical protein [Candidatus Nitrosocosmicus sp. SS]|uniref:hypothetical protein n=1 Tax=Candidatus Nitrosocosmicus agrestis TaxID=2563600 RepID=UPI0012B60EC6|nr:hypothetical protein [Candidatus Nitrosocosmicus sp. SS]MDR4491982.1 hypothetical protein [Candidatus Nitrosocosmicus sp.]